MRRQATTRSSERGAELIGKCHGQRPAVRRQPDPRALARHGEYEPAQYLASTAHRELKLAVQAVGLRLPRVDAHPVVSELRQGRGKRRALEAAALNARLPEFKTGVLQT